MDNIHPKNSYQAVTIHQLPRHQVDAAENGMRFLLTRSTTAVMVKDVLERRGREGVVHSGGS